MKKLNLLTKAICIVCFFFMVEEAFPQRITTIDIRYPQRKAMFIGNVSGYRPDVVSIITLRGDYVTDNSGQGVFLKANANNSHAGALFLQIRNPFPSARIETIDILGQVYNANIRINVEASTGGSNIFSESFKGQYFIRINTADITKRRYLQGSLYNITIRPVVPVHLKGAFVIYPNQMLVRIHTVVIHWGE